MDVACWIGADRDSLGDDSTFCLLDSRFRPSTLLGIGPSALEPLMNPETYREWVRFFTPVRPASMETRHREKK